MRGRCGIGRPGWRVSEGKAAHAAELAAGAIVMPAGMAGIVRTGTSVDRGVLGSGFGIGLHGQALHGLQSGGNGLLIGLGSPHLRIEALIDLTEQGIVRADARHSALGILRWSGAGWLAEFLVSISIHDSDRRRPDALF